jgi:hypothetical protein
MRKATVALLGGLLAGCAGGGSDLATTNQGLTVGLHEQSRIEGSYLKDGLRIAFKAVSERPSQASVRLEVAGRPFDLLADAMAGRIDFDGHEQSLSNAEASALQELRVALGGYLGEDESAVAFQERQLLATVTTWAAAPAGLVHGGRSMSVPRLVRATDLVVDPVQAPLERPFSYNNDGVLCVTRGYRYNVYWDDNGGARSAVHTANSDNCRGRCGSGCGSPGVNRWTLDCLEHDACSRANGGGWDSYGPVLTPCADEWWEASDDFSCTWCNCPG